MTDLWGRLRVTLDLARYRYGAEYYLTTARRMDLCEATVYENGAYFLYDLRK
ncbi:MAG: hypothetical protein ABSG25_10290 [Bryobacteraceae bacterium]